MIRSLRIAALVALLPLQAEARPLSAPAPETTAKVTTCFTAPGMAAHCAARIAGLIDAAKTTVLVQAYSFTSVPIIKALLAAHARGVDVRVVLDKSMEAGRYTGATPLLNAGVPVWIDDAPAIAHNKIIIIDGERTVTGSFNFTAAADTRNAENVVILESPALAQSFAAYWQSRQAVSRAVRR